MRDGNVAFGRQAGGHPSRASAEADGIAWAGEAGSNYLAIEWTD